MDINIKAKAPVVVGDIVILPGNRAGVARMNAMSGDLLPCSASGIFLANAARVKMHDRQPLYWSIEKKVATTDCNAGFFLGLCVGGKVANKTRCKVSINNDG